MHSDGILAAIRLIVKDAFSGSAIGGSVIGVLVAGVSRAIYCSEAGIGTTAILHAASKNHSSINEGIISMLEPLATTIMCLITGLAIVVTNAYSVSGVGCNGILITKSAFLAVSSYFSILLAIVVPLFAFSTVIAYSYYIEISWIYLFSQKSVVVLKVIFVLMVYIGGISREMLPFIQMGDYLYMALVIPNLIALYPLTAQLKQMIYNYKRNSA
jgi:AGCS family alanine or glycine:cation symporter